jgi:uncharacterized repeat protein (TIGR01451 family)
MKFPFATCIGLVIFLSAAGGVLAQEQAHVTLKSEVLREVEIVREDGGKEIGFEPAASARPGEVLLFRITYTNEGKGPAKDVQLTNPVPEHMVYEDGSVQGEGTEITFSVNGGRTYGRPGDLTVTGEDGKERPAGPADYTHIRWTLSGPIPMGQSGTVGFRARLK